MEAEAYSLQIRNRDTESLLGPGAPQCPSWFQGDDEDEQGE